MESDAVSLNFFFGLICWFQLANNFSVPFNFSLYTEKRNLPIAACDSLLVPNYLACSTDFDLPFLLIYLSIYPSIHLSIYPSIHLSIYRSVHISTVSSSIQQKKIFAVNAAPILPSRCGPVPQVQCLFISRCPSKQWLESELESLFAGHPDSCTHSQRKGRLALWFVWVALLAHWKLILVPFDIRHTWLWFAMFAIQSSSDDM